VGGVCVRGRMRGCGQVRGSGARLFRLVRVRVGRGAGGRGRVRACDRGV
jgi:hypothetical protein